MKTIGIKNLRSIVDSGEIQLRPVTLVVGENSSGKSTFLRMYPLLKQSIEVKTNSPILWYTESVDFGSFRDAVNSKDTSKEIGLNFKFDTKSSHTKSSHFFDPRGVVFLRDSFIYEELFIKSYELSVDMALSAIDHNSTCYTNKTNITFEGNVINMSYNLNNEISSLIINNVDFTTIVKNYTLYREQGMLPEIIVVEKGERLIDIFTVGLNGTKRSKSIYNKVINHIKSVSNNKISNSTISQIINRVRLGSDEDMLRILTRDKNIPKTLLAKFNSWSAESEDFTIMKNLLIAFYIPKLVEFINTKINKYFIKSYYIAPVRASAERYYRIQDLAIDEIDSKGRNIPSILKNMPEEERKEFENWSLKNFGFFPQVKQLEGHLSININNGKIDSNMADTGFGYSQILPIVLQMWKIKDGKDGGKVTFVIEQPELHLHPRMQSKLIEALINMTKVDINRINIIIETHSEIIVNKIGHLIFDGKLKSKDAGIYIFEKNELGVTTIQESEYDSQGFLRNWPIGFFEPEEF